MGRQVNVDGNSREKMMIDSLVALDNPQTRLGKKGPVRYTLSQLTT